MLHIMDLTLYVDAVASALMAWTQTAAYYPGRSRNARLAVMFEKYSEWCGECRCSANMFLDHGAYRYTTLGPSKTDHVLARIAREEEHGVPDGWTEEIIGSQRPGDDLLDVRSRLAPFPSRPLGGEQAISEQIRFHNFC